MLSGDVHVVTCISSRRLAKQQQYATSRRFCSGNFSPNTMSSSVLLLFRPSKTSYLRMKYSSPSPCSLAKATLPSLGSSAESPIPACLFCQVCHSSGRLLQRTHCCVSNRCSGFCISTVAQVCLACTHGNEWNTAWAVIVVKLRRTAGDW